MEVLIFDRSSDLLKLPRGLGLRLPKGLPSACLLFSPSPSFCRALAPLPAVLASPLPATVSFLFSLCHPFSRHQMGQLGLLWIISLSLHISSQFLYIKTSTDVWSLTETVWVTLRRKSWWFSPCLHTLGKTLNPGLLSTCSSACECVCANVRNHLYECVCGWVNEDVLLKALWVLE